MIHPAFLSTNESMVREHYRFRHKICLEVYPNEDRSIYIHSFHHNEACSYVCHPCFSHRDIYVYKTQISFVAKVSSCSLVALQFRADSGA